MLEEISVKIEQVDEAQLPAIIREQVDILSEYRKKKDEAKQKAEAAKQLADQIEDVKLFRTKAAVEDLQETAKALSDAQVLAAEAQEKSFEYQKKLATASKYLFALGAKNMAMNRSVVRELRATLEGADPEDLDDLAQKEFDNVISQLLAQEDLMAKQNKMSDTIDILDVELAGHRDQIIRNSEKIIQNEKLIQEGIKKDKEHDRLFAEKEKIDQNQNEVIGEQAKKDEEHDERIDEIRKELDLLSNKITDTVSAKQYKTHMAIIGSISIITFVIAIIGLFL